MNVVIDTNVVASAVFFGGQPRQILELLIRREIGAVVSQEIVEEYQATFDYLLNKYPGKPALIPLRQIVAACRMIEPSTKISLCRDPDDDKFIACAVDGGCAYIVSGDKDLLSLRDVHGIHIRTAAAFLQELQTDF